MRDIITFLLKIAASGDLAFQCPEKLNSATQEIPQQFLHLVLAFSQVEKCAARTMNGVGSDKHARAQGGHGRARAVATEWTCGAPRLHVLCTRTSSPSAQVRRTHGCACSDGGAGLMRNRSIRHRSALQLLLPPACSSRASKLHDRSHLRIVNV